MLYQGPDHTNTTVAGSSASEADDTLLCATHHGVGQQFTHTVARGHEGVAVLQLDARQSAGLGHFDDGTLATETVGGLYTAHQGIVAGDSDAISTQGREKGIEHSVATVAHRQHTTGGTLGSHAAGEGLSCCLAGETPFEGVESYEYLHVVVFLWAKLVISMVSAKLSGRIICIIGEESVILRHESSIRPQQVHHHHPGIA